MADVKKLTDFYQKLISTGVRLKNQYQLIINSGNPTVDSVLQDITIWADGAKVPARTQNSQKMAYLGFDMELPTNLSYSHDFDFTCRCDNANAVRNAFLTWMNTISNANISNSSSGEGEKRIPAVSSVRIRLFNPEFSEEVNGYKLYGVFPNEVGELEMSNAESVEIATFPVKMKYQFWELETNTSGYFETLR